MATITLNGLENPKDIITFSDVPNILTVSNQGSGNKAQLTINVNQLAAIVMNYPYSITVNGEKITAVYDINEAVNKQFYITNSNVSIQRAMVANTIVRALRSCPSLDANYDIYQQTQTGTELTGLIYVRAKEEGYKYNLVYSTDLPQNAVLFNVTQGSTTDSLAAGNNTKIGIDIYKQDPVSSRLGNSITQGDYVTTLEKTYYRDEINFDLSPVLATLTDYDITQPYKLFVYSTIDGIVTPLAYIGSNYSVAGYMVNQGNPFIPNFTNVLLAQNVSRGTVREVINSTILYTYEPNLTFSLYAYANVTALPIIVQYLNSSLNILYTESKPQTITQNLQTINIPLNVNYFREADYVDVNIPNLGKLRYDIIKPINALIENYRIYYHNSYGGISFYDFTGTRTDERRVSNTYYQKQLFDYYRTGKKELRKMYDKTVEVTVDIDTHLMKKDGIWQLYDLQNCKDAWTVVNGVTYSILITDVTVEETSVSGIYEGNVKYIYSMNDTN